MAKYRVLHMGVGHLREGEILDSDEWAATYGPDASIQRLLNLRAIRPLRPDEPAVKAGPNFQHEENRAFQTPTGHFVDEPGKDRPTIEALVRDGQVPVRTVGQRKAMLGRTPAMAKAREQGAASGAARSRDAIREQQDLGLGSDSLGAEDSPIAPRRTAEQLSGQEEREQFQADLDEQTPEEQSPDLVEDGDLPEEPVEAEEPEEPAAEPEAEEPAPEEEPAPAPPPKRKVVPAARAAAKRRAQG